MNPQQPSQDPNQYPIDYLNRIAPEQKRATMSNKLVFALIGGVILVAIIALFAMMSGGSGPTQKMQTLAARMQTLEKISSDAQKKIKSGDLRSTNSSLTIFLTNANRDITDPLKKDGVDVKKLDKNIVAKEKGEKLTQKLEDARLNAVFDRTYSREMTYQLETVAALMKDIYSSSKSKSLRDYLKKTDEGLQPLKKQLSEFNAANG
jgi:hypothetical protein